MPESVFVLHTLFDTSTTGWEWSFDGVFASPELAMEYVPLALSEHDGMKWQLVNCPRGRRWISPVPRAHYRGSGWAAAYVIDEDRIVTSNDRLKGRTDAPSAVSLGGGLVASGWDPADLSSE